MNDSATTDSADTTRRGLLRRGLALAVAAPALLSALHAAPAWANDDDHDDDDDDVRKQRGRDLRPNDDDDDNDDDDARLARVGVQLGRFSAGLCRVADASGFSATSAGTDTLTAGRVRLVGRQNNPDDDKIAVVLHGAPAGATYEVWFAPASGSRESLGNVGPTRDRGNLLALTPKPLAGAHRVGVFVLVRDGHDEFVSCLGD